MAVIFCACNKEGRHFCRPLVEGLICWLEAEPRSELSRERPRQQAARGVDESDWVRERRISRRDLFLASCTTRGVGNCREFIGRESKIVPIVRVVEQIERLED